MGGASWFSAGACPCLHSGGAAKGVVWAGGGQHDEVELLCRHDRHLQRFPRGRNGVLPQRLPLRQDVALLDAGAGGDPLVVGVYQLRQVIIRQELFWHRGAHTG
jgi:hypothetical protein